MTHRNLGWISEDALHGTDTFLHWALVRGPLEHEPFPEVNRAFDPKYLDVAKCDSSREPFLLAENRAANFSNCNRSQEHKKLR